MRTSSPVISSRTPIAAALICALAACGDQGGDPDTSRIVDAEVDTSLGDALTGDATADSDGSDVVLDGEPDAGPDLGPDLETDMAASDVDSDPDIDLGPPPARDPAPAHDGIYGFANGCYAVEGWAGRGEARFVRPLDGGAGFAFGAGEIADGSRFHMRASDLGTYLLYDAERHYLVAGVSGSGQVSGIGGVFGRVAALASDVQLVDDRFRSPAEWAVEVSAQDADRFQLRHFQTGLYLTIDGLTHDRDEAAVITFHERDGCVAFPEMTIDAVGTVAPRQWDDGDVYGIVETHVHLMSNFAFGGGGMFHGAPFHRLGVEHALGSCEAFHGEEGRRDLISLFYDRGLALEIAALLPILAIGQADEFQHFTDGWPEFTDWPSSWSSSTHSTTYYRWVERAYLGGVRLLVQHATGNSVLCDFIKGMGWAETRYGCNDMVSVDRSIEEVYALERYIDAQAGGPGQGWFRVVDSAVAAREVINEGRMAVVLGIEISNLFDCFLTPPDGFEGCDADDVREALDHYHDLGVRVVFPVHKFDNGFAAGDGSSGVIELGNLINSGHYTNMVEECPPGEYGMDNGDLTFGALNRPREVYDAPPPIDMSDFANDPLIALLPLVEELRAGSADGDYCQNAGMTPLGETLLHEMMSRGMIPDIAHLPRRAAVRALEILEEADYPALSTHGRTYDGRLYGLHGMSNSGMGGCGNPDVPGTMMNRLRSRALQRAEQGAYASEGFGFDFNGFAGGRRPRFGDDSRCSQPQANPVTYPFTSHDGDIEFHQPQLGDRTVDFNTEGMLHIGLIPELIEDARRDGATDDDLEPLFRSAEAYLRMWERAEAFAAPR